MNARQIVTNTAQPLPTWLSYSPIVGPSGTSYTILRFPLTYYGPSIPLGTDGVWTYGGLTSPAPSATTAVPTSTPPPVTTSPPTTSLASSTSSTSLISTSTFTTPRTTSFASVSISTRRTTASTAPTQTGTPGGGSKLPPIAIALIVLGAVAAVLLCCLIGALLWRRRKSRRDREPPRGDSEFYAGPPPDDVDSVHAVPNLFGERHSLLGNDSFIVVPGSGNGRSHLMTQRSFGGVSYQRLGESRAPSMVSRRTGSDEIGVAYTDMPPPRSRRRTVTAVSNAVSSSPSHPTSSSRPGIGSMRSHNESQRSSLFERPAAQDESPVLPRDSANGVVKRASDLGARPLQAPVPAAQSPTQHGQGAMLGSELGMLGLGTRYPDPSQSLLATSSSGGSFPPRLVVPTPSSLGSRSRVTDWSRPASQFVAGASQGGSRTSRASRGHSPEPSGPTPPPARDTLTWPESPESEHDESAQLLTAERGNVRSGIGLLGRFSWFARGNGSNGSPAPRTSRNSYPGWMSPPTEEGFLAEADEGGPSASDPPTLESKPPTSHPGMVRLVTRQPSESPARPVSSVSGNTVYHDAPSQPATPRTPVSTWLGFLGRASPASGPAPPVPQRPSPLSQTPTSTPVVAPSTSITPPLPVRTRGSSDSEIDPASRLSRDVPQPRISAHSDILDAPAPESLLDLPPPTLVPPPSPAPVFPPGLTRLPRTWNFGLLNELGDEPPAAEERWANIRATPDLSWDLRRFSLGRTVHVHSPHAVTDSQVASVHGGTTSPTTTDPHRGPISESSSRSRQTGNGSSENSRPSDSDSRRATAGGGNSTRHSVSMSAPGTSADTNTVSSNHPSTLVMTESGHFGGYGYVDSEYDEDYETHATTLSLSSYDSSGREAVDLHGEPREEDVAGGQDVYLRGGERFMPPMSAVGISGWSH